ncbi:porin [Herbaspirillum lusitanum]|uniref:Porin n=1 Tax=Herbaspirillum lusitanum TaxID=213312 RepID=A0ABW9A557_9BURK
MNFTPRHFLSFAMLSIPSLVLAQSLVTFYGQTDASIRYASNDDGSNKSVVKLGGSGIFSNKFGFKGEEDLGRQIKAVFQLEGGFGIDTGKLGAQSPGSNQTNIFGRQSYTGLSGDFGALTMGRQYNALSVFYDFQPVGDHFFVGGDHFFSGYRLNNSLIYKKTQGSFSYQLDYGFGEQAGSLARKSTWGGNLAYKNGHFHTAIAYLQNRSVDGSTIGRYANIGASLVLTPSLSLSGGYARNQESGGARRHREIAFASLAYMLTPVWGVFGSYYHYRQSSCNGNCNQVPGSPNNVSGGIDTTMAGYAVSPDKGKAHVITLITTYDLSKRTKLYAETDWLLARDGAARDHYYSVTAADAPQTRSMRQTNFMVGMKHAF